MPIEMAETRTLLEKQRDKLGLTNVKIACEFGVGENYIYKLMRGQKDGTRGIRGALLDRLNLEERKTVTLRVKKETS